MNTIKKHVYSTSLRGAQVAAENGNFLVNQAEILAAQRTGNLYCVEVKIEAGDTWSVAK